MLRLIRRFALFTIAALAVVLTVLAAVAYFFQDEVKAKLVSELNTHLTAPLHQNGIELTLIKRFPQASLRIHDAYIQEVRTDGKQPDTLLYAKDLYLEFSVFALLTGNYTVRELHGSEVKLYPGLDANGNGTHLYPSAPLLSLSEAEVDGEHPLTYSVRIGGPNNSKYLFSVEGTLPGRSVNVSAELPRQCPSTSTTGSKWASGFYFGGTSTAPSTITGWIQEG